MVITVGRFSGIFRNSFIPLLSDSVQYAQLLLTLFPSVDIFLQSIVKVQVQILYIWIGIPCHRLWRVFLTTEYIFSKFVFTAIF